VGQTIAFGGLFEWAFGPQNPMKKVGQALSPANS
jgi:hypothetical protein